MALESSYRAPAHHGPVHRGPERAAIAVEGQGDALPGGQHAIAGHVLSDECRQVHGLTLERQLAGLDSGDVQQIVHQMQHELAGGIDHIQKFALLRAQRGLGVQQKLAIDHDGAERGTQVVGGQPQELVFEVIEALELEILFGQIALGRHQVAVQAGQLAVEGIAVAQGSRGLGLGAVRHAGGLPRSRETVGSAGAGQEQGAVSSQTAEGQQRLFRVGQGQLTAQGHPAVSELRQKAEGLGQAAGCDQGRKWAPLDGRFAVSAGGAPPAQCFQITTEDQFPGEIVHMAMPHYLPLPGSQDASRQYCNGSRRVRCIRAQAGATGRRDVERVAATEELDAAAGRRGRTLCTSAETPRGRWTWCEIATTSRRAFDVARQAAAGHVARDSRCPAGHLKEIGHHACAQFVVSRRPGRHQAPAHALAAKMRG
jgi:hypothetical protein